ncbi:halocyanin domain-containing protein [Halorientalis salina]|uniref:halocyanin domain-containing protein n=1 Tax=Halorientalis salina TaxID=2932266 RepID=UPI0010ABD3DE|nr:halocyanin domain-containing protein [Halorientalis salina]
MSTNDTTGDSKRSRRGFLRATATGATVAGLGATATGTAAAQDDNTFDGWMEGANNYDGSVADETGTDAVTIEVGAGDNGLAFGPAAVQVDPGTTITWEWTGEGGAHNVVEDGGAFDSGETIQEAGTTFEQTLEEEGVYKYYCNPHQSAGMVGVVVVGEPETGGGHGGEEGGIVLTPELQAMGAAIVLGVLSPIVFAILLALNRDDIDGRDGTGRADADLKRIE